MEKLPSPPFPMTPKPRLGKKIVIAWILLSFLAVYYLWTPYFTLNRLRKAIAQGNEAKLERIIDFPKVRSSLKEQLNAQIHQSLKNELKGNPLAGLATAMSPMVIGRIIDQSVTPSGIIQAAKEPDKKRKLAIFNIPQNASVLRTDLRQFMVFHQGNHFIFELCWFRWIMTRASLDSTLLQETAKEE